ncbi:MAG: GNAT family N-acetyltransferase [Candidatus Riflebacteria bacterium]|nr:GNAT family N-acetyltransferase [Candidatus Riflebacteria bacterium]
MEWEFQVKKISSSDTEEAKYFCDLIERSFEKSQRRPRGVFKKLMEEEPKFVPLLLYADGEKAGVLAFWDLDTFIFAEYVAISPEMRNQGLGSEFLSRFKGKFDKRIVFEVEPPGATPMSRSRVLFYESLGFSVIDKEYLQPVYGTDRKHVHMWLMSDDPALFDVSEHYADKIKASAYNPMYVL